ncbi:hypothetical protein BESB_061030 [Besnoitia besnoiti]|uniref:Uncharacterized protein n=1 Tax=Besnoitia besnoiti TaxID=94643 RepID=A0A2A9MGX7_BESBE|nr:hypothetical protein BESB_061030 [Besnoitia besnoiti]PFH35216.1 hypothetical protein BESB_061030 [Besnoitia besnoiti]
MDRALDSLAELRSGGELEEGGRRESRGRAAEACQTVVSGGCGRWADSECEVAGAPAPDLLRAPLLPLRLQRHTAGDGLATAFANRVEARAPQEAGAFSASPRFKAIKERLAAKPRLGIVLVDLPQIERERLIREEGERNRKKLAAAAEREERTKKAVASRGEKPKRKRVLADSEGAAGGRSEETRLAVIEGSTPAEVFGEREGETSREAHAGDREETGGRRLEITPFADERRAVSSASRAPAARGTRPRGRPPRKASRLGAAAPDAQEGRARAGDKTDSGLARGGKWSPRAAFEDGATQAAVEEAGRAGAPLAQLQEAEEKQKARRRSEGGREEPGDRGRGRGRARRRKEEGARESPEKRRRPRARGVESDAERHPLDAETTPSRGGGSRSLERKRVIPGEVTAGGSSSSLNSFFTPLVVPPARPFASHSSSSASLSPPAVSSRLFCVGRPASSSSAPGVSQSPPRASSSSTSSSSFLRACSLGSPAPSSESPHAAPRRWRVSVSAADSGDGEPVALPSAGLLRPAPNRPRPPEASAVSAEAQPNTPRTHSLSPQSSRSSSFTSASCRGASRSPSSLSPSSPPSPGWGGASSPSSLSASAPFAAAESAALPLASVPCVAAECLCAQNAWLRRDLVGRFERLLRRFSREIRETLHVTAHTAEAVHAFSRVLLKLAHRPEDAEAPAARAREPKEARGETRRNADESRKGRLRAGDETPHRRQAETARRKRKPDDDGARRAPKVQRHIRKAERGADRETDARTEGEGAAEARCSDDAWGSKRRKEWREECRESRSGERHASRDVRASLDAEHVRAQGRVEGRREEWEAARLALATESREEVEILCETGRQLRDDDTAGVPSIEASAAKTAKGRKQRTSVASRNAAEEKRTSQKTGARRTETGEGARFEKEGVHASRESLPPLPRVSSPSSPQGSPLGSPSVSPSSDPCSSSSCSSLSSSPLSATFRSSSPALPLPSLPARHPQATLPSVPRSPSRHSPSSSSSSSSSSAASLSGISPGPSPLQSSAPLPLAEAREPRCTSSSVQFSSAPSRASASPASPSGLASLTPSRAPVRCPASLAVSGVPAFATSSSAPSRFLPAALRPRGRGAAASPSLRASAPRRSALAQARGDRRGERADTLHPPARPLGAAEEKSRAKETEEDAARDSGGGEHTALDRAAHRRDQANSAVSKSAESMEGLEQPASAHGDLPETRPGTTQAGSKAAVSDASAPASGASLEGPVGTASRTAPRDPPSRGAQPPSCAGAQSAPSAASAQASPASTCACSSPAAPSSVFSARAVASAADEFSPSSLPARAQDAVASWLRCARPSEASVLSSLLPSPLLQKVTSSLAYPLPPPSASAPASSPVPAPVSSSVSAPVSSSVCAPVSSSVSAPVSSSVSAPVSSSVSAPVSASSASPPGPAPSCGASPLCSSAAASPLSASLASRFPAAISLGRAVRGRQRDRCNAAGESDGARGRACDGGASSPPREGEFRRPTPDAALVRQKPRGGCATEREEGEATDAAVEGNALETRVEASARRGAGAGGAGGGENGVAERRPDAGTNEESDRGSLGPPACRNGTASAGGAGRLPASTGGEEGGGSANEQGQQLGRLCGSSKEKQTLLASLDLDVFIHQRPLSGDAVLANLYTADRYRGGGAESRAPEAAGGRAGAGGSDAEQGEEAERRRRERQSQLCFSLLFPAQKEGAAAEKGDGAGSPEGAEVKKKKKTRSREGQERHRKRWEEIKRRRLALEQVRRQRAGGQQS